MKDTDGSRGGQLPGNVFLHAAAAAIAAGVIHISAAPGEAVLWILAPTAWMVELFTGLTFSPGPEAGFYNHDTAVVISRACSGATFLAIAFLMAVACFTRHCGSLQRRAAAVAFFALSAYILTVLANATRITGAVLAMELQNYWNLPAKNMVHMAIGTICYATFLVIYYLSLQRALKVRPS